MFCDLDIGIIVVLVCCVNFVFCLTVGELRMVEDGGERVGFPFNGGVVLDGELVFSFFVLDGTSGIIGDTLVISNSEVVDASITV